MIKKYFPNYRADKFGHTDGHTHTQSQADGRTNKQIDAGNDNTPLEMIK